MRREAETPPAHSPGEQHPVSACNRHGKVSLNEKIMSALATRIEREAGRPLTPIEIFNISASRETTLSRLLTLYICTGLAFMLLPGTFLGVWNLIAISTRQSTQTVSSAWIQAHGHAQIFGWIGTFILGIGFYSIPKLRQIGRASCRERV